MKDVTVIFAVKGLYYTVECRQSTRVSVQSSELDPPPFPASECVSPHLGPRRGIHLLGGNGVGRPNSDDWTETLVFYIV